MLLSVTLTAQVNNVCCESSGVVSVRNLVLLAGKETQNHDNDYDDRASVFVQSV